MQRSRDHLDRSSWLRTRLSSKNGWVEQLGVAAGGASDGQRMGTDASIIERQPALFFFGQISPIFARFLRFFRCSLRLGARIPDSVTRRPGAGCATVEGRKEWSLLAACCLKVLVGTHLDEFEMAGCFATRRSRSWRRRSKHCGSGARVRRDFFSSLGNLLIRHLARIFRLIFWLFCG